MIGEKLRELLDIRGMKQTELARLTGISKTTINSIITRNNKSVDFSAIEKISDALDVPIEYFMEKATKKGIQIAELSTRPPVSSEEADFINSYRALDNYGRKAVRAVLSIELLRMNDTDRTQPRQVITLRRYTSPAAAGAPLYAESDYEDVDFPAEIVPDGTSYALGICGKSMEPEIPDGCTVFVEKTEAVCDGDIIVAWIEGDGSVCKRVVMDGDQVVRLESINRKYSDISGEDLNGMRVYGKVLSYTTD